MDEGLVTCVRCKFGVYRLFQLNINEEEKYKCDECGDIITKEEFFSIAKGIDKLESYQVYHKPYLGDERYDSAPYSEDYTDQYDW